jgi:transitional endoplasmic reticulum ATPase
MRFHLDKAKDHLQDGLEAQEAGRLADARYHYLKAAEYMVKAAEKTENRPIAAKRLDYARQLQSKATALEPLIKAAQARKQAPPLAVDGAEIPWLVAERPSTRFADVAGLEDVKEQIRLKLIYPFTHPEHADRFGVRRGGGILLYGPPGTGKTLIARAVAGEVDAAFFTVKPSEIMSKWVGEAEQNVARLFEAARAEPRSIIFLDEVEALVPRRRSSRSTVMQRVVPQFLAELEGFDRHEDEGALLFVGATNEPWSLDPAVMRPGRFDEKIYVPLPGLEARRRILELNLKDRPIGIDIDLDALAERLAGYSGADVVNLCRKACAIPFLEAVEDGVERDVLWADFETVLEGVKPSVSAKDLKRFEDFAGAS